MGSKMTEEERHGELTTDMRDLCSGVPIYKIKTQRLDEDAFAKKIEDAGECYTGHTDLKHGRKKRSAPRYRASCGGCCGKRERRYKRSAGTGNTFGIDLLFTSSLDMKSLNVEDL